LAARKSKKKKTIIAVIFSILLVIVSISAIIGWKVYTMIYQPNVVLQQGETGYIYIKTGSAFNDVANMLYEKGYVINRSSFDWVAERKEYKTKVKAGRYLIKAGMSNNELIDLLRSGKQEPLNLIVNNVRLKEDLASLVSQQIEADSFKLLGMINDPGFCRSLGFNTENILCLFIPNTYQFFWNTSAEQYIDRMKKEYEKFWTDARKEKAKNAGLSLPEVSILASIVEKETLKNDEKPRVAGVYLNRLKNGMLLQADPTLVYAIKDFSIKRVLNIHKETDSPYNTYKYKGLPPGPICVPEISSVDAVLNYEKHEYLYFCAREDFSGYHNFSKNYAQHLIYARKFQSELNKNKIYK
jgi:UPF0755 protein